MICEQCEVEYDLAEGDNYIEPANLTAIEEWHARGHIGRPFGRGRAMSDQPSRYTDLIGKVHDIWAGTFAVSDTDRKETA